MKRKRKRSRTTGAGTGAGTGTAVFPPTPQKPATRTVGTQTSDADQEYKCINAHQEEAYVTSQLYLTRELCRVVCDYIPHDGWVVAPDIRLYKAASSIFGVHLTTAMLHPALIDRVPAQMKTLVFRVGPKPTQNLHKVWIRTYFSGGFDPLDQKFLRITENPDTADPNLQHHGFQYQCGANTFVSAQRMLRSEIMLATAWEVKDDGTILRVGCAYVDAAPYGISPVGFSNGYMVTKSANCQNDVSIKMYKIYDTIDQAKTRIADDLASRVFPEDTPRNSFGTDYLLRDGWLYRTWMTAQDSLRLQAYRIPSEGLASAWVSNWNLGPTWETEVPVLKTERGHPIDVHYLREIEFEACSKTIWFNFAVKPDTLSAWFYMRTDARSNPYKTSTPAPAFA